MNRCGVYCRVSTELQRDNYSIERQKSDGQKFCIDNEYECEIYMDVQSGSTISKRGEFSRLILDIEDKKIDAVWVVEFSRLTRNDEEDSFFIKNLFIEYKIKLFENGVEIKFESPEDQLFYNIRSSVAAYERRKIVERMGNGLRKRVDGGERIIPRLYGYDYDGKNITINEYEADVLRFIYDLASQNKTFTYIQKEMILRGYKQKNGKVEWQTGNISKMLRQKTYIGLVTNSSGEYMESVHYQPIIYIETWEKTQKILESKTFARNNNKYRIGSFELSGLIVCRKCGTKYFRKGNTTEKCGERGFYTHTLNNKGSHECKAKMTQTTIDEKILLYLVRATYMYNFSNYDDIVGFYESEIKRVQDENKIVFNKIEELNKNLSKLKNDKQKLIDAVLSEVFTMDEIRDKKAGIDNQIAMIEERIKEQSQIADTDKSLKDMLDDFTSEEMNDFWDLSEVDRKQLYTKRIKKITLYNRELDVEYINNKTYHFDDIYNLDEKWQGEFDMIKEYYL